MLFYVAIYVAIALLPLSSYVQKAQDLIEREQPDFISPGDILALENASSLPSVELDNSQTLVASRWSVIYSPNIPRFNATVRSDVTKPSMP